MPAKKPSKRKKKVEIACVYCRRSHMICDDSRPCKRCIKRNIGHLCHDEPVNSRQRKKAGVDDPEAEAGSNGNGPRSFLEQPQQIQPQPFVQFDHTLPNSASQISLSNLGASSSVLAQTYNPFFFSEHAGNEFSSLNAFLDMIDDSELNFIPGVNEIAFGDTMSPELPMPAQPPPQIQQIQHAVPQQPHQLRQSFNGNNNDSLQNVFQTAGPLPNSPLFNLQPENQPMVSDSAKAKFFLTAADPTTEISPEERLKQVIHAKLEAGLLQPYNYAKGYARLQAYMDNYMNQSSRQRILKPLLVFRPAFRAIARTLKDVDLVLVEEVFERMLLDYDRVFTSMAIPACLWRRTGEIYRGNKEFASLVEVSVDELKDGKLAIYELMSEESAVNFWEKYGAIAFDKGQKAVLTSCNLRTRDGRKRRACCFSFTIRRDRYNIPSCIVGNFIPIDE
ncbi:hypothetical protein BABINDRAFT_60738 [Babjeviella inositovora NRRL Y-12698]|uniref:Zn(2)-C6 fungal-type domain-containing protein n=1 Tax=Babjeviella inositovora NRRL Y-12698 TaxID=984486 RepID=A0A1E3QSM9_9ASCO|nr:uncharacterized protein BABINDRAFT_60738 [Babjeviella inositovora NRRL Y-12698]ODQ80716.1 hypothetical protein BABINDRAFT_60738 [Babjeviella inositovora NRRL Y-12698]